MSLPAVPSPYSRAQLSGIAVLSWAIAAGATYAGLQDSAPPALADLAPVEGVVSAVVDERYGLGIALEGDTRDYAISNKTGHVQQVAAALRQADGERVTLWADLAHPFGPIWKARKNRYHVHAVAIGDRQVMSRDEAAAGWHADTRIALWIAPFFLLSGFYLFITAKRMPR
jgi:hypothetical protein